MPYINKTKPSIYKTVKTSDLTFTALKVSEGDAFLLKKNKEGGVWTCLFDAGEQQDEVTTILTDDFKIDRLNLAICSHNDSDHAKGFIGLLKSDVVIEEIWLPGTWASILQFIKDNNKNKKVWNAIVNHPYISHGKNTSSLIKKHKRSSLYSKQNIPEEEFNTQMSEFLKFYSKYAIYKMLKNKTSMKIKLNYIMTITALAYHKNCKIKWFEPEDVMLSYPVVGHNFVALNSRPVCKTLGVKTIKSSTGFICLAYLTPENKESLVFEYLDDSGNPIIRFSADTECTVQSKPYNKSIIITAAHHGSKNNKEVYKLNNNHTIWVRTYHRRIQIPCQKFLDLTNKYCLYCTKTKKLEEISFEHIGDSWQNTKGNPCQCKYKKGPGDIIQLL